MLVTGTAAAGNVTDHKVITGKQLKSLSIGTDGTKAASNGGITAFTSKVDGVTRVTYAVVAVKSIDGKYQTNDKYGYVTADSYATDNGYIVYSVWTGTEDVKVQEKGTDARNKGDVIGYSSITKEEGLSDGIVGTIEDVEDNLSALVDNAVIYGVNSKQTKVSMDGKNMNEITSDSKVLFVDTDDHKGYTEGTIVEANDFNSGKIANAMYILKDGKADADIELLIVDVKNNLHGNFNVLFNSDADKTDADDINAALAKGNVTVANLPATGTVTVPADKTLTITSAQTKTAVEAVKAEKTGAKLVLKVACGTMKAGTYTATVTGTGESATTSWK